MKKLSAIILALLVGLIPTIAIAQSATVLSVKDGQQYQQYLAGRNCLAITSISKASNAVVTTNYPHNLNSAGTTSIQIAGALGMTGANGTWTATYISPTTFSINYNSSSASTYTGGGYFPIPQPTPTAWNPIMCPLPPIQSQPATLTFTPGTGYAAGSNIGGLFTVNLSTLFNLNMAGQRVGIRKIFGTISAGTYTTISNIDVAVFPTLPAATFSDGSSPTINAADAAILAKGYVFGLGSGGATIVPGIEWFGLSEPQDFGFICDGNGQLYIDLQAAGTLSLGTPATNGGNVTIEFTYQ